MRIWKFQLEDSEVTWFPDLVKELLWCEMGEDPGRDLNVLWLVVAESGSVSDLLTHSDANSVELGQIWAEVLVQRRTRRRDFKDWRLRSGLRRGCSNENSPGFGWIFAWSETKDSFRRRKEQAITRTGDTGESRWRDNEGGGVDLACFGWEMKAG